MHGYLAKPPADDLTDLVLLKNSILSMIETDLTMMRNSITTIFDQVILRKTWASMSTQVTDKNKSPNKLAKKSADADNLDADMLLKEIDEFVGIYDAPYEPQSKMQLKDPKTAQHAQDTFENDVIKNAASSIFPHFI